VSTPTARPRRCAFGVTIIATALEVDGRFSPGCSASTIALRMKNAYRDGDMKATANYPAGAALVDDAVAAGSPAGRSPPRMWPVVAEGGD
jgi:hypothetical protein